MPVGDGCVLIDVLSMFAHFDCELRVVKWRSVGPLRGVGFQLPRVRGSGPGEDN